MQRLVNKAWRLREGISVVGRDDNNYIFHFNNSNDHRFMLLNGPWSIDGALLIFELWQPNIQLRFYTINNTLIWEQLWGLPLEYQQPKFVHRIAQSIREVSLVDWDSVIPRNIRLIRVRVWINPNYPFLASYMAKRDDGVLTWIEFIYEQIYKVCKRWGIIGHFTLHCPHSNSEIKRMINDQMEGIQRWLECVTGYDLQEFLFTNNLRAFYNR
ncbi:hypothetical protein CRYUN_Cryun10bG0046700 [Craigia yunnanensis]